MGRHELYPKPHLIPVVQDALRQLVPADHYGECGRMRNIIVTNVQAVANMRLWKQYSLQRSQIAQSISTRRDCSKASLLQNLLPHVHLDDGANEVLLLHGTSKADEIALQGLMTG